MAKLERSSFRITPSAAIDEVSRTASTALDSVTEKDSSISEVMSPFTSTMIVAVS